MEEEREDRSGTVNVFIKKSSLSNRKTKLDDFFGNEANRLIDEPNISHFLLEEGRDSCFHSLPLFPQRVNSNGKRIKLFPFHEPLLFSRTVCQTRRSKVSILRKNSTAVQRFDCRARSL